MQGIFLRLQQEHNSCDMLDEAQLQEAFGSVLGPQSVRAQPSRSTEMGTADLLLDNTNSSVADLMHQVQVQGGSDSKWGVLRDRCQYIQNPKACVLVSANA